MTTRNAFPDGHASGHWLRTVRILDPNVTKYVTGSDTTKIKARLWAAGGAGGGTATTASGTNAACAGGGGAGSYAETNFAVTPNTAYVCAIGLGGVPGTAGNNAGGNGGNTTLTVGTVTVTCNGGSGGSGSAAQAGAALGGPGGGGGAISTNGDFNLIGDTGFYGFTTAVLASGETAVGGRGAYPAHNVGQPGQEVQGASSAGNSAMGYCAGGGGARSVGTAGPFAGGAGASGAIIIEEFS